MGKRRAAIKVPSTEDWTVDSLVSKGDVVAFIASRDIESADSSRMARDRARHLINYHIRRGSLATKGRSSLLRVGDLGRFLRQRFPEGRYDDVPAKVTHTSKVAIGIRASARIVRVSGDLKECQEQVLQLADRVRELEQDLAKAKRKVAELLPAAEKWRELRTTNTVNAKRPRFK